jgi:hypothetical protein
MEVASIRYVTSTHPLLVLLALLLLKGFFTIHSEDFNYPYPDKCQPDICNERLIHWSIVRPTCGAVEENRLVGPLLSDPILQRQYLGYVQAFVGEVYSNSSLIDQMTQHVNAIESYASRDVFSTFGIYFRNELSQDAAEWNVGKLPLLPTMKARATDVEAQLKSISDGTFPRGPLVSAIDNEPWEKCADWRAKEPDTTSCELGCQYDGCHVDGWTVASYCDESTGLCYHGDYDEACQNIVNGEQYPGMQNRLDGRDAFCRFAQGLPVKASVCPPFNDLVAASIIDGDDQTPSLRQSACRPSWSMAGLLLLGAASMLAVRL